MKKNSLHSIFILMTAILFAAVLLLSVSASEYKLTGDSHTTLRGNTVDVTFDLEAPELIAALRFEVTYDASALKPISLSGDPIYSSNIEQPSFDSGVGTFKVFGYDIENGVGDSVITFEVLDSAAAKTYDISVSVLECTNNDYDYLTLDVVNGSITVKDKFDVRYDANGGSNAPDPQTIYSGDTLTLSTVTPTITDQMFKGWSTSPDGKVEFVPGQEIEIKGDLYLYAVWSYDFNGACGENATWKININVGELIISGSGSMDDYSANNPAPWSSIATHVKTVSIGDNITSIGSNAFYGCNNLTSIHIPYLVNDINADAFAGCDSLATAYVFENTFAHTYFTENYPEVNLVLLQLDINTVAEGFMTFDGYQVRMVEYNGLRSIFVVDLTKLPNINKYGFEVVEYGTLVASAEKLARNGDTLTVSKNDSGMYNTLPYARMVTIMRNGVYEGKLLVKNKTTIKYACTATNLNIDTFDKNINIRGYMVLEDAAGEQYVLYCDYANPAYRSVSLEQICSMLAIKGMVTKENCISYAQSLEFRRKKDMTDADNEIEGDSFEIWQDINRLDRPFDEITVEGVDLADFKTYAVPESTTGSISYPILSEVRSIMNANLREAGGFELKTATSLENGSHYVIIEADEVADVDSYSIRIENGNIYLTGSYASVKVAAEKLTTDLIGYVKGSTEKGLKANLTADDSIKGSMNLTVPYNRSELLQLFKDAYENDDMILTGTHTWSWSGANGKDIQVTEECFESVGFDTSVILELDVGSYSPLSAANNGVDKLDDYTLSCLVSEAKDHVSKGGVIAVCAHFINPTGDYGPFGSEYYGDIGGDWNAYLMTTKNTSQNRTLHQSIDGTIRLAKALNDNGIPFLLRPFHEMNGDWFWWSIGGDNMSASSFKRLWNYLYNEITEVQGVTEALWVYAPNAPYGPIDVMDAYPGNEYVDIVGMDAYIGGDTTSKYNENGFWDKLMATGKPVAFTEFGVHDNYIIEDENGNRTYNYTGAQMIAELKSMINNGHKLAYLETWTWSIMIYLEDADAFMNDPIIYTRSEIMDYWNTH
ncbi:MAG: hypothetical protein E7671_01305 [Ruminococcaceae bacterium]|nr:hypothetical protein [Oscillospiraceae bacterium]